MTELSIGDKAPDFNLPVAEGKTVCLKDFEGQNLVLYFYPKDDTPGCTKQACAFNDGLPQFESLNAAILGVSKDSLAKHDKFKQKYGLNFMLGADEECKLCEAYGVWVEKSMYGKKYMGIQRATFLIDGTGHIAHIWPKVKVPGHADDVRAAIEGLQSKAA